ncbi:YARHG domain-containing protein [Treponema brennaborense]|uniref:YARHG domain-containing protein n=1 Tax=Treponema brennaborense (strain DSM 12168 / CIP 105900 / DD5/3) TaxID=906968 RepID=F4LM21_TREBD|nr:YARHG domain-containing protein [Treponema brennaborense]AEE16700.1 hypothetical protein Trebr_1273 [Treponema brennaborense DSM 12168]
MKKITMYVFLSILVFPVDSQTIEKVFQTDEIVHKTRTIYESPFGIYVDEIEQKIEIMNGNWDGSNEIHIGTNQEIIPKDNVQAAWGEVYIKMDDFYIGGSASYITIQKSKKIINEIKDTKSGISFILKEGNGYIVYYVNDKGIPRAVDTEGRIYENTEAIAYLKEYDEQKYEQSVQRATELGLADRFRNNEVLVWGRTYYSTVDILETYWGKSPYIISGQIQYDAQGYGYQCDFYGKKYKSFLCIVSPEGERINITGLTDFSNILSTYEDGCRFSTSMYVGFGGNIYYYIAGEEYTEVFRIRRTWGEPDLYAMAINGYTDDSYGKYVEETLAKLSKAELRLLRNTVFALYGYTFKSEDLKNHFDKQVWYTDESKTASDMTLPLHRQKLLELVQAEEAKR